MVAWTWHTSCHLLTADLSRNKFCGLLFSGLPLLLGEKQNPDVECRPCKMLFVLPSFLTAHDPAPRGLRGVSPQYGRRLPALHHAPHSLTFSLLPPPLHLVNACHPSESSSCVTSSRKPFWMSPTSSPPCSLCVSFVALR